MIYIASVSWGKDSTAMLLRLLSENKPLDEVVFFDTGMEFQAIYDVRDFVVPEYWQKLRDLQAVIKQPMKGHYKGDPVGVFELEERFKAGN